jgi:competence protein ComEC
MKALRVTLLAAILSVFFTISGYAHSLQIHHINVNNGDATVVAVMDDDYRYVDKVLIDGGQAKADERLLPYLIAVFGDADFKYVILTHYHDDHYIGLNSLGQLGNIQAKYLIDLGSYDLSGNPQLPPAVLANIQPANLGALFSVPDKYRDAVKEATAKTLERFPDFNPKRGDEAKTINKIVPMFSDGDINVQLRCVAFFEYTLGPDGKAVNNHRDIADPSPNNYSIAFVLECGEFRYLLAGDMGGTNKGIYIDQETTLVKGLQFLYKGAKSFDKSSKETSDGHICGFKTNHHGSAHSNNAGFLKAIRPAISVTSAGDKSSWHLPNIEFLERLNATTPISLTPPQVERGFVQGFYFTNLHNFTYKGKDYFSLNKAKALFEGRPNTDFSFGDNDIPRSYLIEVNIDEHVRKESKFSVYSVFLPDNQGKYNLSGTYYCHKH